MNKKLIIITTTIILFICIIISLYLIVNYENGELPEGIFVQEIIDGDTIKMNNGEIIRLLCVNTPETNEAGYEEAITFLESIILNKKIILEDGENLEKIDKYERNLKFVYIETNGEKILINKEIIRLGFGEFYPYNDETNECEKVLNLN